MATHTVSEGGNASTPSNGGPTVSPSAARAAADVILATQHALTIWMAAAHVGCTLDDKIASDLQNAAAAVDESMQGAEATCMTLDLDGDFNSARHLVRMIDMALWNFQGNEIEAPDAADLIATADLALDRLVSLSLKLATIAGGAQ